jgi:flagellar motor switch protein FliN/FliY
MSDLYATDGAILAQTAGQSITPEDVLTPEESDALGEIGNICMGTSATTLSTLLGKTVSITTPRVGVCAGARDFVGDYKKPFLASSCK